MKINYPFPGSNLSYHRTAVVIGAGITGSLTAVAFHKAGWNVVLVDQGALGAGSSARSAACIRQQFDTPDTVKAMRFAVQYYRDFASHLGMEFEPLIVENGYLFLFDDPAKVESAKKRVAMQQGVGLTEVKWLNPDELCARFGFIPNGKFLGATFCPSDGFLRADLVYMKAVEFLRNQGARVVLNNRIVNGVHENGRLTSVRTIKNDLIEGDIFVNATNIWASELSVALGGTSLPIEAWKRYLYYLDKKDERRDVHLLPLPMTIVPSGGYCRPENNHQLLFAKAQPTKHDERFSDNQDSIQNHFFHKNTDGYAYEVWAEMAEYLPFLEEWFKGISAVTAGYYAVTPDRNPFLDVDPAVRNLIHAVGFSGHGAMMGPFSAEAVMARANGESRVILPTGDVDLGAFAINRDLHAHVEGLVI